MTKPTMAAPGAPAEEIRPELFCFLQRFLYQESGLVLEADKQYLVLSRLGPLARELGLGTANDLCGLLMATRRPDLSRRIIDAMTTHETYFFREPAQYDAIRTVLLPRLRRERRPTERLRFWSAAASSGQEAYSLAMLLCEEGFDDREVEILATDISEAVLERARRHQYSQIEINRGLPAALLVRYFRRVGLEWRLDDAVAAMVRFEPFDLRRPMGGLGPFELVFCRNVLIYFDAETRRRILAEIRRTLVPGGWLLIGAVENALGAEDLYERQTIGATVIYVAR